MVTIAYDFFNAALGTATRRSNSINLAMLGLLQLNAEPNSLKRKPGTQFAHCHPNPMGSL
jgi:hypothetical protein